MNRHNNHRRRTRSSSEYNNDYAYVKRSDGKIIYQNKDHWSKMCSTLKRFRNDSKYCDFRLRVHNKTFNVHKVILGSCSHYFDALFSNDMTEKDRDFVEIKGISLKIFEILLEYMYSGEVVIGTDNVQELLSAANMLELLEIVTFCCKYLSKQLDPTNCVGILRFADFQCCTSLRLDAKRYIERHFAEVIREEEFLDIPQELLKSFLRSEGLSIDNEFQVLEATIYWIKKDLENRIKYFAELIECIRIPVIPIKQIETFMTDCNNLELKNSLENVVKKHKESIIMYEINKKSNLMSNKNLVQNGYYDVRWQPRMCARKYVYFIGGYHQSGHRWVDGRPVNSADKLDILKSQWKSLPSLKHSRSHHCIAVLNGLIFVAGGECDSLLLDSVEIYDPFDNEWTIGKSLIQPRSCFGMCPLHNYIYVFGGWVGNSASNNIERFDPELNEWSIYDRLPDIRFSMGVIAYDGLIYIIGGINEQNRVLKSVLCYNPITREFQYLSPMIHCRACFGCTILHGNIYIVGGTADGNNALSSVERYNIYENIWSSVNDMDISRVSPSAAAVNECLLVFGGKTVGDDISIASTLDSVDIYDPESNQWHQSIPLLNSRCEATVAVI